MAERSWYLLVHRLPTEPIYLRAKISQRLARAGAIALKNSVYVLPRDRETLETLQWVLQQARAAGGEASLCEATFVARTDSTSLVDRFNADRNARYETLAAEIREALAATGRTAATARQRLDARARLTRLTKRSADLHAIDFFEAPARAGAEDLLRSLERRVGAFATRKTPELASKLRGRLWATRRGLHIDRLGSAWLIRRFIDPEARFRFIDPNAERRPGELRFDMVGGDFTHEGDRCTFETLLGTAARPDPALKQVAEIIHDVDLKDGKFDRPEAPGVQQIVLGIVLQCPDDEDRLKRGFELFDGLYASFRRGTPSLSRGKESRRERNGGRR